jgi:hypothetical protein
MWTAPMPLLSRAGIEIGAVKTDGDRVSITAMGSGYGLPALSFELAAVNTLGAMPPMLTEDWVSGIARTLERHGYTVRRGMLARN